MKKILFAVFAAAVLLMGTTGCSKADDPSPIDIEALEQSLVGLWWDEFEYADVTETGVPFSRVLLAVIANADHTGCIYLGVFNDTSDEPLAIYGGPKDAAFTWHLLANGNILLGDPVTGETYEMARTRGDDGSGEGSGDGSYGDGMTDISKTNLTYTDGSVTLTNGDYSGTLGKADANQAADIEKKLSQLSSATNLGGDDAIGINGTPQGTWGR
jgi:hypothetical protein